jgi:hypothetical protein
MSNVDGGAQVLLDKQSDLPHHADLKFLEEGNLDPTLKTVTFSRGGKPPARLHYTARGSD